MPRAKGSVEAKTADEHAAENVRRLTTQTAYLNKAMHILLTIVLLSFLAFVTVPLTVQTKQAVDNALTWSADWLSTTSGVCKSACAAAT